MMKPGSPLEHPILVLNTTLTGVGVGLFFSRAARNPAYSRFSFETYGSSEYLAVAVREVLSESGIHFSGLGGLVVAHGPGSFTGIKIGLAFCQGLLCGSEFDIPHCGVSSMEGYCLGVNRAPVILPVTRTNGFLFNGEDHTAFRIGDGGIESILEKTGRENADLHLMADWPEFSSWAQGRGFLLYEESFEKVARKSLHGIYLLGIEKIEQGSFNDRLEPQYLKKPACEEAGP